MVFYKSVIELQGRFLSSKRQNERNIVIFKIDNYAYIMSSVK